MPVAKADKVRDAAQGSNKRRKESHDELEDIANMDGDSAADSQAVDSVEPCVAEPPAKQLRRGDGDGSDSGGRSASSNNAEVMRGGAVSFPAREPCVTRPPATRNQVPKDRAAAQGRKKRRPGKETSDVSGDSDGEDSAKDQVERAPAKRRRRFWRTNVTTKPIFPYHDIA